MRQANGLHSWTGRISIIGSTAAHALAQGERRNLRPRLSGGASCASSLTVARTEEEFRQAEHLVLSAYAGLGYDTQFLVSQHGDRRTDPSRLTILSSLDCQPAGTFTVFLDGPHGVQADLAYPEAIDAIRSTGQSIVELGQFATLPFDNFQSSQIVISALHNGVYLLCASLKQKRTTIVFEVNPHHVKYWRSLGWRVVGPPRRCDRVNAPGVLMVVDFADYTQTLLQCWPLHARHQEMAGRAWQRVIRYSMLWEDVDGVLARIRGHAPTHAGAMPRDLSGEPLRSPSFPAIPAAGPTRHVQSG
ncbi:MAG: hypothetical protein RL404_725 [Pseudomonadota bacterium]